MLYPPINVRLLFLLCSQNSDTRSQFQEFLSLNGHHLEQRPFPNVVQLALSQPHASEVYRQALWQAQEQTGTGKLYFDWLYANQRVGSLSSLVVVSSVVYLFRNKNLVESLSRLVIHPHQGSIYSACFSHDGTKIASCGACKTLKVSARV